MNNKRTKRKIDKIENVNLFLYTETHSRDFPKLFVSIFPYNCFHDETDFPDFFNICALFLLAVIEGVQNRRMSIKCLLLYWLNIGRLMEFENKDSMVR